ncbi:recombinase family protein [uncultured Sphingomonas sp.]|uniref:recombinase family protein n=1 Tax=uncultured Sphingomonas sp. TaxID=158754 RepID=UPI0025E5A16A|nr:recombinase family protein [uncultured Sphingomonas sp.]
MIAHSYFRFSHSDQAGGTSIERQRKVCQALIERKGWTRGEEFIDRAKSASKGANRLKGAALFEFEAEARAGQHHGSVLVVEKLDRLSRQGYDSTRDFIRDLGAHGVSVATEDGGWYEAGKSHDLIDIMTMLIKAETAREEAQKRSDRTRERHAINRKKAEAGLAVGKLAPAWIDIKGGRYVANADKAALVRRIFDMADAGDGSLTIAKKLNKEGVEPWQRWAKRPVRMWDQTRIRKILADDAVIGWRRGVGDPIRIYPAIVDSDVFERVRSSADLRKSTRGGGPSSAVGNLVGGIASCTVCGSKMVYLRVRSAGSTYIAKPSGRVLTCKRDAARLMCRSAANGKCSNKKAAIGYLKFEDALLDEVLHIAMDDRAFRRGDELAKIAGELADLRHSLTVAKARAEKLWTSWAESDAAGEPSEMRERLAVKAEKEAKDLQVRIDTALEEQKVAQGQATSAEHMSRIEEVRKHLYDDDIEVRRIHRKKVMESLHSVIEHVWCDADRVATIGFKGGIKAIQIKSGKVIKRADALMMHQAGMMRGDDMKTVDVIARRMSAQR